MIWYPMKTLDVSQGVMDRVVRLEKRRTRHWLWMFRTAVGLLGAVLLFLLWRGWRLIAERGTLDMLELLREDREIIAEYWRDTADVIIAELPQKTLLRAILVGIVIVVILLLTRRHRRIIQRKLQHIAKASKKG